MKKKFFMMFIIVAVLISLVPLHVFADSYSYICRRANYVSGLDISDEANAYTYIWFGEYNGSDKFGGIYIDLNTTNVNNTGYFFLVSVPNSSTQYYVYCCTEGRLSTTSEKLAFRIRKDYQTSSGTTITSTSSYNALLNLSYNQYVSAVAGVPYCNVFNTLDEGLNALRTAIDNGTADGTPDYGPARLYVKPGNVAYISISGGHVELYVDVGRYFRGQYYSNQRWSTASSLPSSSISLTPTYGTGIIYTAAGASNILGQQKAGVADLPGGSDPFSAGYVVIYNPVYDQGGDLNPTIRVDVDDFIAVAQYPLTSSVNNGIVEASGSVDEVYAATSEDVNNDGTFDYIYSYTDGNGNTTTSSAITTPTGGNTVITENDNNTISGLLESILDIFRAPITHIQNLFNAGINFFGWIAQLWVWLPPAVSGIITSALVALIAIGVIKFLWK